MDQKQQKEKFIELSNLIRETGKLYADCLKNPSQAKENSKQIRELETLGDKIQSQLDNQFRSQKNIPYLALDRAKLARKLDETLDQIRIAGMTFATFAQGLPQDFSQKCEKLAEVTEKITDLIAKAVEVIYTSFENALDLIIKIEDLRDEGMESAFSLENEYFDAADASSGWKEYTAISRVIKRTIACIGTAKEASEVLELMAYKYD